MNKFLLVLATMLAAVPSVPAGPLRITPVAAFVGGTGAHGGTYALDGTPGQADVSAASGGSYKLSAGFWTLAGVVRSDGQPNLVIETSAEGFRLSWESSVPGYILQTNDGLDPSKWVNVVPGSFGAGPKYGAAFKFGQGPIFFRLGK